MVHPAQQAAFDEAVKWAEEHVSSWSDLFGMIHRTMNNFHQTGADPDAGIALFTSYAFVVTMEMFPEEGDALVIAKHMMRLLYLEPEKMGAQVTVIAAEDVQKAAEVMRLMGGVAEAQEEPEEPEAPKQWLH